LQIYKKSAILDLMYKNPSSSPENLKAPQLNPEVITLVQDMFSTEADRVINNLKWMNSDVREVAINTLRDWNNAMAANDNKFSIQARA
jgi:hypothetical protein